MILTIVDENVGYSDGHYITVWWTGKMLWASGQVTGFRCTGLFTRLGTWQDVGTGLLLDR